MDDYNVEVTVDGPHQLSEEVLQHFRCAACNHWWSSSFHRKENDVLYCPACGHSAKIEKIVPDHPMGPNPLKYEEGKGSEKDAEDYVHRIRVQAQIILFKTPVQFLLCQRKTDELWELPKSYFLREPFEESLVGVCQYKIGIDIEGENIVPFGPCPYLIADDLGCSFLTLFFEHKSLILCGDLVILRFRYKNFSWVTSETLPKRVSNPVCDLIALVGWLGKGRG